MTNKVQNDAGDKVLANLKEACHRYKLHKWLKTSSMPFYASLSTADQKFVSDWISAEHMMMNGNDTNDNQIRDYLMQTWASILTRAPILPHRITLYRAVEGAHARDLARLSVGKSMDIGRYSSFTHSPDMVRKYAIFLVEPGASRRPRDVNVTIMCVAVRKGTPYAYISAPEAVGKLSDVDIDDIDSTQGEVILPPMGIRKIAANRHTELCEGVYASKNDRTCRITVATFEAI